MYLDMCRTVFGAGKGNGKKEIKKTRTTVAEALSDYFAVKPKTKEEAFDGWYGSVLFAAQAPAHLSVGQAQKLLNMAFKYLCCCEGFRGEHRSHFNCCHMSRDSYTFAWCKRGCDPDYGGEAWSAIDDAAKYHRIVETTRDKLKGKVVLEEEFSIWADGKARIERDDTRKAALKVASCNGCPDELKEQLESYAELLAN